MEEVVGRLPDGERHEGRPLEQVGEAGKGQTTCAKERTITEKQTPGPKPNTTPIYGDVA